MTVTNEMRPARRGGRKRSFDCDEALEAAMRAFWTHGYEGTSLAMLQRAMGLTPPQIYNAFVDKRTLFASALDRYLERETGFAAEALGADVPARTAIARLLKGAAAAYTAEGKPSGCLFVVGGLTAAPGEPEIGAELMRRRTGTVDAIQDRLARAPKDELPDALPVDALAGYIAGAIHGMAIRARDGATRSVLERHADLAMAFW